MLPLIFDPNKIQSDLTPDQVDLVWSFDIDLPLGYRINFNTDTKEYFLERYFSILGCYLPVVFSPSFNQDMFPVQSTQPAKLTSLIADYFLQGTEDNLLRCDLRG